MRILTGIQPSGKLHWGNYFGAMKSMFDLQDRGENFMFIANYHAMTTVSDGKKLREATRDVALDYLACGLDTEKTVIYRQSDVPEVQELAVFWTVPYLNGSAKISFERANGGMRYTDQMFDKNFNK
jgi:tryptophanyl-tRNA synthetase